MGYPAEIFEVTRDLTEDWQRYAVLVSDTVPFTEAQRALVLATTPGAAEKVRDQGFRKIGSTLR
ncbi:hypothetical protein [Winogradskya humida]|uniref:Uncharacterized protein n=1 Tax=Winogradskya humida TaxID=113566 RepID=A0ABQ4A5E3_9ACTN|nr:hypothetical protein [Actinoplanes humidus]GIE25567.1 hypothetical protein Ahu01nite_086690 [Actinoplanes humidus]